MKLETRKTPTLRFERAGQVLAVGVAGVLDQAAVLETASAARLKVRAVVFDAAKSTYVTFVSVNIPDSAAAEAALTHWEGLLEERGIPWVTWKND